MSPETMRWASPSTIAVFPTPGSPMSTGLFLVRRESTWITRLISSSRPMTGSSFPRRASSVRSRPKRSSAWYFSSGVGVFGPLEPRISLSTCRMASRVTPLRLKRSPSQALLAARPMSTCSVET